MGFGVAEDDGKAAEHADRNRADHLEPAKFATMIGWGKILEDEWCCKWHFSVVDGGENSKLF